MKEKYIKHYKIIKYMDGNIESLNDKVIVEDWIKLYINNKLLLETPSTNKEINELIMGILFTYNLIEINERPEIDINKNKVYVNIEKEINIKSQKDIIDCFTSRIVFREDVEKLNYNIKFNSSKIISLVRDFQSLPSIYKETGGTHSACIAKDKILLWADDISRRSAVDKVIGKSILNTIDINDKIMIISGRISSELTAKVIQAKIPVLVSISAPTDKAIDLADYYGLTIAGFARGKKINFYTHTYRIDLKN